MYYLEKKQLQSQLILLSAVFLPFVIITLIAYFITFDKIAIIILSSILVVYTIIVFVLFFLSMKKSNYLKVMDNTLIINYPNINGGNGYLEIISNKIISIDYYKITTPKNWLMLFNYVLPKCVYITYQDANNKFCRDFIGYLDINDIKRISRQLNVKLAVH